MKKIVLLFGLLFALQTMLVAQDSEPVIFNAHLLSVFELTVVSGGVQEITFANAADYNNGVDETGGMSCWPDPVRCAARLAPTSQPTIGIRD